MEISFDSNISYETRVASATQPDAQEAFKWDYHPSTGQRGYFDREGNWYHWLSRTEFGYKDKEGNWHIHSKKHVGYPSNKESFIWHYAKNGTYGYFDESKNWIHWQKMKYGWIPGGNSEGDKLGYYDAAGKWHLIAISVSDCYEPGEGKQGSSM